MRGNLYRLRPSVAKRDADLIFVSFDYEADRLEIEQDGHYVLVPAEDIYEFAGLLRDISIDKEVRPHES